jgi:hypothetical protein
MRAAPTKADQSSYFRLNWRLRRPSFVVSLPSVDVALPLGCPYGEGGMPNWPAPLAPPQLGWFNQLKASARNVTRWCSVIENVLNRPRFQFWKPVIHHRPPASSRRPGGSSPVVRQTAAGDPCAENSYFCARLSRKLMFFLRGPRPLDGTPAKSGANVLLVACCSQEAQAKVVRRRRGTDSTADCKSEPAVGGTAAPAAFPAGAR